MFNFIILLVISRFFGPEEFGEFSFSLAIASITAMVVDFGINHVLIRDFTKEKNKKESLFSNAIILRIIISVVLCGLVIFFLEFLEKDLLLKYLIILLVVQSVFYVLNTTFFATYRSQGAFKYETLLKTINRSVTLFLVIFFITLRGSILSMGVAFFIGAILTLLITILLNRIRYRKPNLEGIKSLFRESWPFGILIILTAIYYKNSTIILSHLSNDYIVGNYNVAFNLILLFILVPGILSNSAYPIIAKLKIKEEIFIHIRKYRFLMLFYSGICILGSLLLGKWFVEVVYGIDFRVAASMLSVLSFSTVFLFQNILSSLLLATLRKQQVILVESLVVTIMNIALNIVLIAQNNLYGAALAFLISESIGYAIYHMYLRRNQFCHSRVDEHL